MAVKHTRAEESLALMKEVYTLLDEPGCGISFSPAKSGNFMMYCSGDFVGGLFGGELCLVYTEAAAKLLGRPEPVYRGYSSEALHRMLPVPLPSTAAIRAKRSTECCPSRLIWRRRRCG